MNNKNVTYEELTHEWSDRINVDTFKGFVDETIRDGLHSKSAPVLTINEKEELLSSTKDVNVIPDIILGMITANKDNLNEIEQLVMFCKIKKLKKQLWVLSRCNLEDIHKAFESQILSPDNIGINLFINCSKIRQYIENWNYKEKIDILNKIILIIKDKKYKIRVGIEDATRTHPEQLFDLCSILIKNKVDRIAFADTAGIANFSCIQRIGHFIQKLSSLSIFNNNITEFEWHGHNDKGLAVATSLECLNHGINYIHGTMFGIGERNGNAALDTMFYNLPVQFVAKQKEYFEEYCHLAEKYFKHHIIDSYPYLGKNTYTTSLGTHAAAQIKAIEMGYPDIASHLFSPKSVLNSYDKLKFFISYWSGQTLLKYILKKNCITYKNHCIKQILEKIKKEKQILTEDEFIKLYQAEKEDIVE